MIGEKPICSTCKHFFRDETVEEKNGREGFRCAAFPEKGIPEDIFWGDFIHVEEHPDQEVPGITFEKED